MNLIGIGNVSKIAVAEINVSLVFCEKEAPKWLIMEYCEHGNLNDYLRSISDTEEDKILEFSSFVYQITSGQYLSTSGLVQMQNFFFTFYSGLDHLHQYKCLHRDLATRNILLVS